MRMAIELSLRLIDRDTKVQLGLARDHRVQSESGTLAPHVDKEGGGKVGGERRKK